MRDDDDEIEWIDDNVFFMVLNQHWPIFWLFD